MAEEKEKEVPQTTPTLPTPRQDVWGRDLPLPESAENNKRDTGKTDEAIERVGETIAESVEESLALQRDVIEQFQKYVDAIKASNQNFFLKYSRVFVNEFKKSVVEGLVEGSEKRGDTSLLDSMHKEFVNTYKRLDKLILIQEDANKLQQQENENDEQAEADRKKKDAEKSENDREARRKDSLKKFFDGYFQRIDGNDNKNNRSKNNNDKGILSSLFGGGMGFLGKGSLLGILGRGALKSLPILGILTLFSDMEAFAKNPVWDKVGDTIGKMTGWAEKLFTNVLKPTGQFLVDNTIPAALEGVVDVINDLDGLFTKVGDIWKGEGDIGDKIAKSTEELAKTLGEIAIDVGKASLAAIGAKSAAKNFSDAFVDLETKWKEAGEESIWSWKHYTQAFDAFRKAADKTLEQDFGIIVNDEVRKKNSEALDKFTQGIFDKVGNGVSSFFSTMSNPEMYNMDIREASKQQQPKIAGLPDGNNIETIKKGLGVIGEGLNKLLFPELRYFADADKEPRDTRMRGFGIKPEEEKPLIKKPWDGTLEDERNKQREKIDDFKGNVSDALGLKQLNLMLAETANSMGDIGGIYETLFGEKPDDAVKRLDKLLVNREFLDKMNELHIDKHPQKDEPVLDLKKSIVPPTKTKTQQFISEGKAKDSATKTAMSLVAPNIVSAPTNISSSSHTSINAPARVGNDRSMFDRMSAYDF